MKCGIGIQSLSAIEIEMFTISEAAAVVLIAAGKEERKDLMLQLFSFTRKLA